MIIITLPEKNKLTDFIGLLRNHSSILTTNGWIHSPDYDINSVERGTGLSLNISEKDNALDLN